VTEGPGRFIAFEGIEGAGKSTQIGRLAATLRQRGYEVVQTLEPGGTSFGVHLRQLVMQPTDDPPVALTELMLYLADRAQHVEQVIRPSLARGAVVLSDRFSGSTIAYQGYGRGLELGIVKGLDAAVRRGVWPQRTVLLDCPLERGLGRATGDDRMQREKVEFHRRVQSGFHALAADDPTWAIVSSEPPPDEVAIAVLAAVESILPPIVPPCPSPTS
jgi:dTMP kinase